MCQVKANSWKVHYGYGKCLKCGCTELNILTWHHRNKKTKQLKPSTYACKVHALQELRNTDYSRAKWLSLRAEIRKCDLLCKYCHQHIHTTEDKLAKDNRDYKKHKGSFKHAMWNLGHVKITDARRAELTALFWKSIGGKTNHDER